MTEVNLKEITEAFKALAIKESWCEEAERRFMLATGVKPLPAEEVKSSCGCGFEGCDITSTTIKDEARFRLPEDAPETVPSEPILRALRVRAIRLEREDYCCNDCANENAREVEKLQSIANLLPGSPKLLA